MNHQLTEQERISQYVRDLKISTIKDNLEEAVSTAMEEHWTYQHFLAELLQKEVDTRVENRKIQRIRKACFPQMKYLQELEREELPADGRNLLPELETLDFIRQGRGIIMYGNPGTGKTHIAIGLGIKACMEGYSVYFTTIPHLLTQIREAANTKTLQQLETKFKKHDLVICDELGYVNFDKAGADMLFNHLSLRSGGKATIITTNLPFTRWDEVMHDKVLCAALVDRLCHRSYMINMTGQSYRVKETKIMMKK